MSRVDPGFGLVLIDGGISSSTLTAVGAGGAGSADSIYTEAGPGPGAPVPADSASKWRPQIRQAQTVSVSVVTVRGGFPGRDGAQVLSRLAGETANDSRSWQEPCLITDWSSPADGWGSAIAYTDYAATVIEETGVIVVVAMDNATNNGQTWSYAPQTGVWTTLYDWDAGALDGLNAPLGMTYDASRSRLILWSGNDDFRGITGFVMAIAYYSDDFGVTWQRYSQGVVYGQAGLQGSSGTDITVAQAPSGEWMLCTQRFAIDQWASSDRGVIWEKIADLAIDRGRLVYGPAGFALIGIDGSSDLVCWMSASARGPLALVSTVAVGDYLGCVACVDGDGTIYVVAQGATAGPPGTLGNLTAFRSFDGGLTWTKYEWGVYRSGSATVYLTPLQLLASSGAIYLFATPFGSSSTNSTIAILKLGGWSQVAHGVGEYYALSQYRHGWGTVSAATNAWSVGYVPIALPQNQAWTAGAATGTAAFSAEPGLHLSTTAGQAIDYFAGGPGPALFACAEVAVRLATSGNVTLATMGAAGGGAYFNLVLSGVGYYYEARVDIASNGLQLREIGTPAILASATTDMTAVTTPVPTSGYVHVRLSLTKGNASAWYSRDGGLTWVRWANAVTIPNIAPFAANDVAFFGIAAPQVGDAYFRLVGVAGSADWNYGIDSLSDIGSSAQNGVRGHIIGRSVPGLGYAYPIPFAGVSGARMPLLTATGGPTYLGETVVLPVAYTYPVTALSPIDSPRPSLEWRSTDAAACRFVYDQGADQSSWYGGGVALIVIRAWPRQWVLERSENGTAWTTLGTLDLAVGTGLSWARVGRTITPTGAPTIARYFQRDELKAGYLLDGTYARKINSNSPGFWQASGTNQALRLQIAGATGADPASGTAGVLVAPTGVLCAYPAADTATRYLRITIAASQVTPDGTYHAGIAGIGEILGVGADPSWQWTVTHQMARRVTRFTDGGLAARRVGPSHRIGRYTWPDGIALQKMRLLTDVPDYVAISGGSPIGTMEDAWSSLPQALGSRLESGTLPVVMLPRLPTTDGVTLTQPELVLYGLAAADSIMLTGQPGGTEGVSEILVVDGFSVEELVP